MAALKQRIEALKRGVAKNRRNEDNLRARREQAEAAAKAKEDKNQKR